MQIKIYRESRPLLDPQELVENRPNVPVIDDFFVPINYFGSDLKKITPTISHYGIDGVHFTIGERFGFTDMVHTTPLLRSITISKNSTHSWVLEVEPIKGQPEPNAPDSELVADCMSRYESIAHFRAK